MFKNEAEFSRTLRFWLVEEGVAVQAIESAGVAVGIPDMYVSGERVKGWLELKNVKHIGMAKNVPFRPGQYSWLRRFAKHGTFCALLIAHDEGVSIMIGKDIKPRYTEHEIRQFSVPSTSVDVVHALESAYDATPKSVCNDSDDVSDYSVDPISGYIRCTKGRPVQ